MPTLEQITETGIFSLGTSGFHREFVPFDEELTAESFAEEINSGRLSVQDAYRNFWSYEEDAELWGLPKEQEWRALLPAWKNILSYILLLLKPSPALELADIAYNQEKEYRSLSSFGFDPFNEDLCLILKNIPRGNPQISKRFQEIVSRFEKGLDSSYGFELNDAISILISIGDDNAVSSLKQRLHDHRYSPLHEGSYDWELSWDIEEALKKIGSPTALKALGQYENEVSINYWIDYLSDPNKDKRKAFMALAEIGGEQSVSFLEKVVHTGHPIERHYAIITLGAIGGDRAAKCLSDLMTMEGKEELPYTVDALCRIRGDIGEESLHKYFANPKRVQSFLAAEALSQIADDQNIREVVNRLLDLSSRFGHFITVSLPHRGYRKLLKDFVDYLTNPNHGGRRYARFALDQKREEEILDFLANYILNPHNIDRYPVAYSFGYLCMIRALKTMQKLRCNKSDTYLHIVLESIHAPDPESFLSGYLRAPHYTGWPLVILGLLDNPRLEDVLIKQLSSEEEHYGLSLSCAATSFLGCIKHQNSVPALIQYILREGSKQKLSAIRSLGCIGGERTNAFLKNYALDPNNQKNFYAMATLAESGDEEVIPLLEQKMGEEHMQLDVVKALGKIRRLSSLKVLIKHYDPRYIEYHNTVKKIHESLKPQGYNPPVKRLAA